MDRAGLSRWNAIVSHADRKMDRQGGVDMNPVAVRYIVDDVDAAVSFYTEHLGFSVEMEPAPGFAMLARDDSSLLLNAPGAGGAGQAVAGQTPQPGGWNRFQLVVEDLAGLHQRLQAKGLSFKSGIIEGQGGKQLLLQDPAGNLVELFEPKARVEPIPKGFHTVTPFLLADDLEALLQFIETAFAGTLNYSMKSDDGVVRHATIRVGNSLLMLSKGVDIYGRKPAMLHLYVANADAVYAQAVKAGAKSLREPHNEFYGDHVAAVQDAWDNQWWIATHVEDVEPAELTRREAEFRARGAS